MLRILANYSISYMVFSLFIGMFELFDTAVSIFLIRYLIIAITNEYTNSTTIIIVLMALCAIRIIMTIIESYYNNIFLPRQQIEIKKRVHENLFGIIVKMNYSNYDNPRYYDDYSYVIEEAEGRLFSVFLSVKNFIIGVLQIVFVIASITYLFREPIVILFPVIIVLNNTIFYNKASDTIFKRNEENIPHNRRVDYIKRVFYLKEYARTIRLSNISNVMKQYFYRALRDSSDVFRKYGKKIIKYNVILTVSYNIFSQFGLLSYLFIKAIEGTISIADFSGLYAAAGCLLATMERLSRIIKDFHESNLYIEKYKDFNKLVYEDVLKDNTEQIGFNPQKYNAVMFENVSFTYKNAHKKALNNINISIKKGEKVAIVGENGAGKSTLVDLLLGLYDTYSGKITINNINIKDISIDDYRKLFNIVPQNYNIFAGTIAENVRMDLVEEDDNENITKALSNVGLYDLIELGKNNNYGTQMTKEFEESGVILSGGQMQKIAIARLFLNDAPIIIMDEPSSALDPVSEYNIFKNIFSKYRDESIIFISHRLYVSALSDKVIVMKDGSIIEQGTHDDLLKKDGEYSRLYRATTENYHLI